MKLPTLPNGDRIRKVTQVQFGGYNHTVGAGDGELYDMSNLSARDWPVLSVRPKRQSGVLPSGVEAANTTSNGLYAMDKLVAVGPADTGELNPHNPYLYYGERKVGALSNSVKQFASIGKLLVILPDNVCYDTREDDIPNERRFSTVSDMNTYASQHAASLTAGDMAGVGTADSDGITIYDLYYWDSTQFVKVGHKSFGALEAETTYSGYWSIRDGFYADEPADSNTIHNANVDFSAVFNEGDAVHIVEATPDPSGRTRIDKTAVIREISSDGHKLRFYENTFEQDATDCVAEKADQTRTAIWLSAHYVGSSVTIEKDLFRFKVNQNTEIAISAAGATSAVGKYFIEEAPGTSTNGIVYAKTVYKITAATYVSADNNLKLTLELHRAQRVTYTNQLTLSREVPEMDFICSNDNRIWGCKDNIIYASKPGDPWNWNVFDGLASDSYSVESGTPGNFTACVSYLGYPIFFKEQEITKIYGKYPSNYELIASPAQGVMAGSHASLAVAGSTLFYLSRTGPCAYTGSQPVDLSAPFGETQYSAGVGGSDGERYFLSMKDSSNAWHLFHYTARLGLWIREDNTHAVAFAYLSGLYCMSTGGTFLVDSPNGNESSVTWEALFGDFTDQDPNRKGVSKIQIRLELEANSQCQVWMSYDDASYGESPIWSTTTAENKRSYYLPIVPRRCDHYRIKLTGYGQVRLYSLAREQYSGSEIH